MLFGAPKKLKYTEQNHPTDYYSVPDTPGSLLSVIQPLCTNWHVVSLFCVKKKTVPFLGEDPPTMSR
jgi:hypothetical protein